MINKSFCRRLASYSAAAAGIVSAHASHAQIVYTDIPDVTLKTQYGDTYCLDLNNDGICDFHIAMRESFGNILDEIYQSCPEPGGGCNQVAAYNNAGYAEPVNILRGQKIGPGGQWYTPERGGYFHLGISSSEAGQWAGGIKNGFLGVRFYVDTIRYYGWVRLSVNRSGIKVVVRDYAYESSGKSIIAGNDGIHDSTANKVGENQLNVSLYPNPAAQYLLIRGIDNEAAIQEVRVSDLQGRMIKVVPLSEFLSGKMDVSQLNNGLYFLRISTKNGMDIAKFFVQR